MVNTIKIVNKLSAPHAEDNISLNKILSGRLKRLGREQQYPECKQEYYWPAEFFGLQYSSLFLKASTDQQQQILHYCSQALFQEAYFIEKSGIAYCAKMVLLSETTEIAQNYCVMGADEATHLQWVSPYLSKDERTQPAGKFFRFISQVIEEGDSNCLLYLMQVILEGWGLSHYRDLAKHSSQPHLQALFMDILRDEASHQQLGITLFDPAQLTKNQSSFIIDSLVDFLEMVKAGPQLLLRSMELGLGELTSPAKLQLLNEISWPETAARKLNILRQLIALPGCEKLLASLEEKKLFEPYSPEECLMIL